jgi:hypothetical protein
LKEYKDDEYLEYRLWVSAFILTLYSKSLLSFFFITLLDMWSEDCSTL